MKPPTNVKEVKHLLGLTGYYHKSFCNYADIAYPLNYVTYIAQLFVWPLECQASFDMLQLRLINTQIVQLPDPSKPYLLFMDASKFCYLGVLTQASTKESNEALMRISHQQDSTNKCYITTQDL